MRMPKRGNRAGKGRDSNSIPPLLEQGVSIILMDYVVEHQNRLLIERFGDLKGKLCYEGYYGRKKPCEFCALRQAIESGRSKVHEVKTKDGRIHEFRFIPFTDASGVTKVVEVTTDIAERKRVEEALRESEEKLQCMFESVTDGITVTDLNGVIIELNQGALEIHGVGSKDEALGKHSWEFIAPRDREKVAEHTGKTIEQGRPTAVEYTLVKADGSEFPGEISASVLKGASGNPIGFIGITRDITERKRMEEQLISSERLAAIGQLASGVAHELRNPLGAIRNAVFYVRRRIAKSTLPATEPKVLEFLDIIDGEVNSANKVINDLLGFSRIAKPTVSSVNIGGIIEDAIKHVPMPENVELTRDVDSSLPMVMVDAEQVQRVFVNVIFNAVEAMPQGGRLGIRARSKGEFVEVEFTDTGCGILKSAINKIFDPLFTTKAKGIGLGLPMCKSTIERHGGGIGVESKEGEGTTFTVSLPTQAV